MKNFILLLKSFRLLNVFSMLLLLVGLRFYFWKNIATEDVYSFDKTHLEFFYLLLVVGIVSASGYLINDIIDVKVDSVNQPNKKMPFSNIQLWLIYVGMITLAITISLIQFKDSNTIMILLSTIVLLFLYSIFFQKLPLIGNFVVAVLSGVLPLLYYSFDSTQIDWESTVMLSNYEMSLNIDQLNILFLYSYLGGGLTFLRELIKDIEDVEGDSSANYRTFPVLFDVEYSKLVFYIFTVVLLGWIFGVKNEFLYNNLCYYIPTLVLLGVSVYQVIVSNFTKASLFLKLTLFSGVLILFVL